MADYNEIAGKNLDRMAALSDGIFAVAMTILVLDIHIPELSGIHSEAALQHALAGMTTQLIPFLMSFMTLGIFWMGQQTQFNLFKKSDRHIQWIHIGFLIFVCILPLSTRLLAEFITFQTALFVYWANILFLGAMLYWSWIYARNNGLVEQEVLLKIGKGNDRRIIVAQALYFGAMLLGFISTYIGIAAFIIIQLDYAVAPAFSWRRRKKLESSGR